MSCAQPHRLRHLVEAQLAFHLRVDKLPYPSQACWAESASGYLHRTVPHCVTADQGNSHRLFDRIQKQPPVRKPSHHLGMNGRNQRTEARVCKLAVRAKFHLAIPFVTGSHERRIGNTELQMRYVHEPDPLSHMTIAQR